jgi:cytochrome P450
MTSADAFAQVVPEHVPRELVKAYPATRGMTTTELPNVWLSQLHDGPGIFFAPEVPPLGVPGWVVCTAEYCRQVTMDTDHFSNRDMLPFALLTGGDWKMIPAEIDPPMHLHYRTILNPLLAPRAVAQLDDKVAQYAREYIAVFKDRGHCEFMTEFASEYPVQIFLELMGLPTEKAPQFRHWTHSMVHATTIEEVQSSTQAVVDYLRAEINNRRDAPTQDFIGHVLRSEIDGRKLDDNEMLGICFTLFIGGLDTVAAHLGHMIRHLAEHQDDQAYLRANRDKIGEAVEEMMRAYGAANMTRLCVKDTTIGGVTIKAGDRVLVGFSAAGRDPSEYPDPGEVRFDRNPKQLSFGHGRHLCIGMHLARRELRIAIDALFDMLPPFRIAPGTVIVSDIGGMLQPQSVPLVWDV